MKRLLAIAFTIGLSLVACDKEDPNDCKTWEKKLQNAADVEPAIRKIGELKCTAALPVLTQMYKDGEHRLLILETTRQLGDKQGGAEIVIAALKTTNDAKLALEMISEWKLAGAREQIVAILGDEQRADIMPDALNSLLVVEDPKNIEDTLLKLADSDINAIGYKVVGTAVEQLGKLRSEKAKKILVKTAFIRTAKGEEVYQWARPAVAHYGKDIVDELLVLSKGEDKETYDAAKKYGVASWELSGPKLAQMLGDTLDPRVAGELVKYLGQDIVVPTGISDRALEAWKNGQINRFKMVMLGLGQIGSDEVTPELITILKDPMKDATRQRINAAMALAFIGSPAAQAGLADAWKTETHQPFKRPILQVAALGWGKDIITTESAAINDAMTEFRKTVDEVKLSLAKSKTQLNDAKASGDQAAVAKAERAVAIDEADLSAFEATVEKLTGYLAVANECGDDVACLTKQLDNSDKFRKEKAAVLLMRHPKTPAVENALINLIKTADNMKELDAKRFALLALARIGDKQTGEKLAKLADEVKDDAFWNGEISAVALALQAK